MATDLILEEDPFVFPEVAIKNTILQLRDFVAQLNVVDEISYKKVTSLYRQAREWKKCLEAKRKELVEPFRTEVARINDKAKELSEPLDNVINLANAKVNAYQRLLEDAKRLEEEKLREAASLFDAEDEVFVAPLDKVIRGDGAMAITKTEKRFKVTDLSKVPLKYLTINEKIVEQDMKLGINEIPGLEIWEETSTQLRIR